MDEQEIRSCRNDMMCIELLDIFLEKSDVLYKNITNQSDLYRYIIKLLEGNIDTKAQLLHGMNVLSELLKNVSLQYHIRMENETSHIYQLLIKVMTSYSDDIDLLVPTLLSLLGVLLADSSIHKAMITDHLAMMISFLEKPQDDKNLVTIVLQVFIVTAQDEEIRALLINEGVHEMIIEGLTPVKEEVEYKCACCALLDTLCEEDDVCVQLVNNDFLHNFIISLMVNIPESVSIQCSLLRIFKKLAQLTFETEVSSETEQNVCIVIYRAMFRHIEKRICVNLMERNAHMAVIDGLRLHLSDNLSVISACRALRGICIFHEKHKHSVIAEGALSLLTTLLTTYSDKEEVQNEIISTLACLADIDIVRYQCFIENVPSKILNCMRKFSENVILQEACLECLCVMSGAEDGTQCLNAVGTFRHAIDILNKHQNCKKGLMLLQLLAEPSICNDKSLCKGLSKILANAMKDNFHDDSILKEACVLVQIYAEMGKEMSKHFVEEGCHDLLFSIMEHHDDNTDLQDIASECLCVLSLEHDLKSNMLLSACSNGIVAGVDCLLEIGADVNFGQGQDTPLCHAVRCQNENLVKLLLKQSVIDSHLHNALMISLKLPSHQITGLLLSSIAKSSDQDVSHITWSGLQLPDVRPEWFVEDLSDQMPRNGSDTGKYITKKIKESHRRRSSTGLYYSESDSKLVSLRKRKQFRFRSDRRFLSDISDNASDFRGLNAFPMPEEPVKFYFSESQNSTFYEFSSKETEEWKTSTLTGANIPISPSDPRFRRKSSLLDQTISQGHDGIWMRKSSRSPSPRLSHKIEETSFIEFLNKLKSKLAKKSLKKKFNSYLFFLIKIILNLNFKSQVPTVVLSSDIENSQIIRPEKIRKRWHSGPAQMNPGSVNDTEDIVYSQMDLNCRRPSIESVLYQHLNSDSNRSSFTSKQQLKLLDISCNIITSLSHLAESEQTMKKIFSNLVKLYLNDNLIEEIPDAIFKISKVECEHKHDLLQELHLSNNALVTIPEHLCHNEIKVLPDKSLGLKNLKKLYLSHNKINKIPEMFLQDCKELDTLEAAYNALECLPSESIATSLQLLNRVKLKNNSLTEKEPFFVPKFLLELQSLRVIDLSENGLFGLPPPSMWKTQMLKELHASKNYITKFTCNYYFGLHFGLHVIITLVYINYEFGLHVVIISVYIYDIGLHVIIILVSITMALFLNLPLFGLDLDLDRSLLKGNVKDLIAFLHNKHKKAIEYYRLKMMVVGFGGRGKTTLLQALMKKYKAKNTNTATVGVIVKTWKFERFRADLRKTVTYTISTWDFAGQEEFYSTHQCYLSNRALYLVVYDIRKGPKEMELLKPWLANIHARAPECPVIIVGTHLDAISEDKQEIIFKNNNKHYSSLTFNLFQYMSFNKSSYRQH
ncbi:hypothetical protein KUTeg_021234 [Tegillarca granosa]|uniref:Roc domain-containing protein n=1 Tax=Tegillarca granosa TaxID=220873 RepID=A0ABQ9EFA8_TEGGR|nr:hypothetical protein KUTeg_021234 [Tegillarca granosa]